MACARIPLNPQFLASPGIAKLRFAFVPPDPKPLIQFTQMKVPPQHV